MRCFKLFMLWIFTIGLIPYGYADIPDPYQNSGSNNVAYDVPSKFYLGANVGMSWINHPKGMYQDNSISLNQKSTFLGFLAGFRWNDFMSLELNADQLGRFTDRHSKIVDYRANLYQLNLATLFSYPLVRAYYSTLSVFGKVGYGLHMTHYNMRYLGHHDSGHCYHGAYHFGLGFNLDLRSNISLRMSDTYYRVYYPLPGHHQRHRMNVLSLGLHYNFV